MANTKPHYLFIFFLLFISTFTKINSESSNSSPTHPPISFKPIKNPSEENLETIMNAISSKKDFRKWAEILSETNNSRTFPLTATIFIPTDNALTNITSLQWNSSVFAYHVIQQKLTFSLLQSFKIGSRIPTLLPNNTILVTNNSVSNYTLDNSEITHPDLYNNGVISVHGIGSLFNYSVYGGGEIDMIDHKGHQDSIPSTPYQTSDMKKILPPLVLVCGLILVLNIDWIVQHQEILRLMISLFWQLCRMYVIILVIIYHYNVGRRELWGV